MSEADGGFLLLDKPAGISSFQALRPVKKLYPKQKTGHAGTLDPAASGLLLVGVGSATRLLEYMEGLPKTYAFAVRFGVTTDTRDMEGTIIAEGDASGVTLETLEAALRPFRGAITQTPPDFSALKVNGERAYDLARAGKSFVLPPREVFVHSLELKSFSAGEAVLEMTCSKGTYVRSLAHDLGQALGCGAAADRIRRVAIGTFRVEQAVAPDALEKGKGLLPLSAAVAHLPAVVIHEHRVPEFLNGKQMLPDTYALKTDFESENDASFSEDGKTYRALDASGRLLAVATLNPEGLLCPKKVLTAR